MGKVLVEIPELDGFVTRSQGNRQYMYKMLTESRWGNLVVRVVALPVLSALPGPSKNLVHQVDSRDEYVR